MVVISEMENFKLCYLTYAHALMELTKKLMQGELLPSDNFSNASQELSMLIETAVYFLRKEPLDGAEKKRDQ